MQLLNLFLALLPALATAIPTDLTGRYNVHAHLHHDDNQTKGLGPDDFGWWLLAYTDYGCQGDKILSMYDNQPRECTQLNEFKRPIRSIAVKGERQGWAFHLTSHKQCTSMGMRLVQTLGHEPRRWFCYDSGGIFFSEDPFVAYKVDDWRVY